MLHADLTRHVFATEPLVGRQPRGRIAIGLLLVGTPLHGQQIVRIVRQCGAALLAELLRALLPRIAQRHHMVDLHRGGSLLALLELDVLASVWIMQFSGLHHAIVRTPLVPHAGQIAVEDIIAGVAAVVVHVGPRLAELSALVPGFRRAALDLQRIQHLRGGRAGPGAIRRLVRIRRTDRQSDGQTRSQQSGQNDHHRTMTTHDTLLTLKTPQVVQEYPRNEFESLIYGRFFGMPKPVFRIRQDVWQESAV